MLERDDWKFYDTSGLKKTEGIEDRMRQEYLRRELEKRFPGEEFPEIKAEINRTGHYQAKASLLEKAFGAGKPIEGLPEYIEVEVRHRTGKYFETLIVWSPTAWNDRFAGTAGGGTGIGGRGYLTKPNNTQRGWTVPMAVMNGFTAATMFAENIDGWDDHTIDKKTGALNREIYENWRLRSTHDMTIFGKAVAEILHGRPVRYSYMNGGSGGGRQSLMEVQNYPYDYDGVWASCPAINWQKFLTAGFWPEVVMNETGHFLTAEKNQYFLDAAHRINGGKERFFHLTPEEQKHFDAMDFVGEKTGKGKQVITQEDARVMNEIIRGPHRPDGSFLWYGFRAGAQNWQKVIPIGTYYYTLSGRKIKPFILGPLCARWITENPKQDFSKMKAAEFADLFDRGVEKFSDNLGDDPAVDEFVKAGGKLMIDHGIDDPLIPVDGTLDYAGKLLEHFGGQEKLDPWFRLYITPGDNHGNCQGNGPGMTEKSGMTALIRWVEEGIAPEEIRAVRVDRKSGELLEEGTAKPYRFASAEPGSPDNGGTVGAEESAEIADEKNDGKGETT